MTTPTEQTQACSAGSLFMHGHDALSFCRCNACVERVVGVRHLLHHMRRRMDDAQPHVCGLCWRVCVARVYVRACVWGVCEGRVWGMCEGRVWGGV